MSCVYFFHKNAPPGARSLAIEVRALCCVALSRRVQSGSPGHARHCCDTSSCVFFFHRGPSVHRLMGGSKAVLPLGIVHQRYATDYIDAPPGLPPISRHAPITVAIRRPLFFAQVRTMFQKIPVLVTRATILSKESLVTQPTDQNQKALLHAAERPAETETHAHTHKHTHTHTHTLTDTHREMYCFFLYL